MVCPCQRRLGIQISSRWLDGRLRLGQTGLRAFMEVHKVPLVGGGVLDHRVTVISEGGRRTQDTPMVCLTYLQFLVSAAFRPNAFVGTRFGVVSMMRGNATEQYAQAMYDQRTIVDTVDCSHLRFGSGRKHRRRGLVAP